MRQYLKRFNYPNNWICPSLGLSGGTALLWKSGFTLNIVQSTDKMIHTTISYDPSKPEFLATFLYGSTYHDEKIAQWNHIDSIGADINLPWVLIGDLNITMFAHERSTNTRQTTIKYPIIQQVIDRSDLIDLGYIGAQFTWSNRQSDSDNVKARLDRSLVNGHWLHHYNNSKLFHIDAIGSDHLHIAVTIKEKNPTNILNVGLKILLVNKLLGMPIELMLEGLMLLKWSTALEVLNMSLRNEIFPTMNNEAIKEVEHNLELAQKAQESFYAQKSRDDFIKNYDRNTSYYHTYVNIRRHFNHVSSLKLTNGQWSEDRDSLEDLLVTHFKIISTTTNPTLNDDLLNCIDRCVTNEDNDKLLSPITLDEIRNTIKQMAPWTAPGPDGFPPGFYKQNLNLLEQDVLETVKSFFDSKHLLKKMNHTFISLIPKCISTTNTSILLNGSPCTYFSPTRGLRQGDPLSPYLFILCMESFSRYLKHAEHSNLIHGLKVTKEAPSISHLLFADDCLLFTKSTHNESSNLMSLIRYFSSISGQMINFEKSACFFSKNVQPDHCVSLIRAMNVRKIKINEKYLGIPLFITRNRTECMSHSNTHHDYRVSKWKGRQLAQSGRSILVQHTLKSSSNYHMNSFLLPDNIINKMEQSQRDFRWGKNGHKGHYFRKWEKIDHNSLADIAAKHSRMLRISGEWDVNNHPNFLPQAVISH
ncbi:uncharacterized protein LOC113272003 [Papaver somniferum]|uniref:uncharacterized protein LOC113272003 n=1 Tax=Papaver somniferum TaxID=3469 RepID=UPI000E6FE078|nr:uncharacterized protein LOC113272003 [Papaver somniferum]